MERRLCRKNVEGKCQKIKARKKLGQKLSQKLQQIPSKNRFKIQSNNPTNGAARRARRPIFVASAACGACVPDSGTLAAPWVVLQHSTPTSAKGSGTAARLTALAQRPGCAVGRTRHGSQRAGAFLPARRPPVRRAWAARTRQGRQQRALRAGGSQSRCQLTRVGHLGGPGVGRR